MTTEKLEESMVNRNTEIFNLKRELVNLDELIKGYSSYTDNVFMIEKLQNISQRMKNNLMSLEVACGNINDFIESTVDF